MGSPYDYHGVIALSNPTLRGEGRVQRAARSCGFCVALMRNNVWVTKRCRNGVGGGKGRNYILE